MVGLLGVVQAWMRRTASDYVGLHRTASDCVGLPWMMFDTVSLLQPETWIVGSGLRLKAAAALAQLTPLSPRTREAGHGGRRWYGSTYRSFKCPPNRMRPTQFCQERTSRHSADRGLHSSTCRCKPDKAVLERTSRCRGGAPAAAAPAAARSVSCVSCVSCVSVSGMAMAPASKGWQKSWQRRPRSAPKSARAWRRSDDGRLEALGARPL